MGGNYLQIRYDRERHTYVIVTDSFTRDGIYSSNSLLRVFSGVDQSVEHDISTTYCNISSGSHYISKADEVRAQTDLYYESGDEFRFWKINGAYVSKDEYDAMKARFVGSSNGRYQMYTGTYEEPISGVFYNAKGDVTGDGKVNISDVSLVLKLIAKWDVEFK